MKALESTLGSGDALLTKVNEELKKRGLQSSTGVSPKSTGTVLKSASATTITGVLSLLALLEYYTNTKVQILTLETFSGSSYRLSWTLGIVLVLVSALGHL